MKVIIVGAGKVGMTLADHLSKADNDVVLVDNNVEVLQQAQDSMNVFCVKGNGISMMSLIEAGIREAELLIAVTSSDEVNMLCCLTAKRMGVGHTVARIRDPEYSKELNALKRELGLDMVINPEYQTAMEIARILRFPAAISIDPFANGRIELVAYRITDGDPIIGIPLCKAMASVKESVLFCTILRGEEVIIPRGDSMLQDGDVAYIIGRGSQILSFFRSIKRKTHSVRNTLVIGGGKVSYYLCDTILRSGIRVKMIDEDEQRCEEMDEKLPECIVIHGDGTDAHLLESENIQDAESIVLLTGTDEQNIITGLYAKHVGVNKIIVKVNRDSYQDLMKELNLDCVVSPKDITAEQILRYVRAMKNSIGSNVEMLYNLAGGRAEALQFSVRETTRNVGVPFSKVKFRRNVLVAAIVRDGRVIIPSGSDTLEQKDTVIIITSHSNFDDLNDTFEG